MSQQPIAFITGAAGGIGRDLCRGFARAGYRVIATDQTPYAFDEENIHFYVLDLRDEQAIRALFATVTHAYGGLQVLINNGAISKFHTDFLQLTMAEFDQVMAVNVRAAVICAQEFVKSNQLVNNDKWVSDDESVKPSLALNYGRIINIASTRWQQNEPGWDAYGASKGALVALTQSLAMSLAEHRITVNAISPGWIQAEDYHSLSQGDHQQHPSGRVGRPDDITRACVFLAEPNNDFVNGANWVIDGGMSKKMIYQTSASFWESQDALA